jgi:hypothetical protein
MSLEESLELRLSASQDPFNISTTFLDHDRWAMDFMEDSIHQGCPFLGMADETRNHCWVCAYVRLYKYLLTLHLASQERRCGSPSHIQT